MITKQDFIDNNFSIPVNTSDIIVNTIVSEATLFDLRDAFVFDTIYYEYVDAVEKEPIEARWIPVKEGSTYTYNNRTYRHGGVDKAILYWAYARFVERSNIIPTPTGINVRQNAGFINADTKVIRDLCNQYKRMGGVTFDDTQKYIKRSGLFEEYILSNEPADDYNEFDLNYKVVRPSRNPRRSL